MGAKPRRVLWDVGRHAEEEGEEEEESGSKFARELCIFRVA